MNTPTKASAAKTATSKAATPRKRVTASKPSTPPASTPGPTPKTSGKTTAGATAREAAAKPASVVKRAQRATAKVGRQLSDVILDNPVAGALLSNPVADVIKASPAAVVEAATHAGAAANAIVLAHRANRLSDEVRNKVVVVTGATSGIGEDCALKLGAAGAVVILAARTPQKLEETLNKIRSRGGKAHAYACDISDLADCDAFCKVVLEDHGHVDILINNAGRSIRRSVQNSFDRFHDFERTMQLNFFGALRLIFGFSPIMLERRSGHIINISSIGVLASPPRFSAYVASKAALDAFSWCAASEFSDHNVRFTTINMPLVRTPMIAPTKMYDAFPTLSPDEAAELVMRAVVDKPKRVATGLGLAGAVAQAVAPGISEFVLNQAYRLFPDSAAASGLNAQEAEELQRSIPKTPVDMARKFFAQVFNGVHW